jgi:hypothetical protein
VQLPIRAGDRLWTSSRVSTDATTVFIFAARGAKREHGHIVTSSARALCVRGASRERDPLPPLSQAEIDEAIDAERRRPAEELEREAWREEYEALRAAASEKGYVEDPRTGLTWAPRSSGTELTRDAAETFCRDVTLAGFHDWRLPLLAELQAIHAPPLRAQGTRLPLRLARLEVWSGEPVERDTGTSGTYAWKFRFEDCAGDECRIRAETTQRAQALCVRR